MSVETRDAVRLLEDAAQTWLEASHTLGDALTGETPPERVRPILQRILSGGDTTLARLGGSVSQDLLSRIHTQLAAAHTDLAGLEPDDGTRAEQIARGVEHCELAVAAAFRTGTTSIPAEVIPGAMILLDVAMRKADSQRHRAIEARIEGLGRELAPILERMKRERSEAAEALFVSQSVLLASRGLEPPSERASARADAMELAKLALRDSVSAGDVEVARQARATIAELEAGQG